MIFITSGQVFVSLNSLRLRISEVQYSLYGTCENLMLGTFSLTGTFAIVCVTNRFGSCEHSCALKHRVSSLKPMFSTVRAVT